MAGQQRPAPMDPKKTEQMNLQVMTRLDPATQEILATSGHVALYDYNVQAKTWARKDVEGSLFLKKRSTHPTYQFTILNKKSQCNYSEELSPAFTFEEQNSQYLLYRNVQNEVLCLWFFSPEDCSKVAKLLRGIIGDSSGAFTIGSEQQAPNEPAAPANGSYQPKGNGHGRQGADTGFWDRPSSANQAKQLQSTQSALNSGASASRSGDLPSGDSGPLQKLFSNIKLGPGVAPQHTHTAEQRGSAAVTVQPQPGRSGSGGVPSPSPSAPAALPAVSGASASASSSRFAATPGKSHGPPSRPPLLTPSFFKQPAQQREQGVSPLPFSLGSEGSAAQDSAPDLSRVSPDRSGAAPARQQRQSGSSGSTSPAPSDAQRAAVKRALFQLLEQDEFLDMVAGALLQNGAL